jgi:hypothetical protein
MRTIPGSPEYDKDFKIPEWEGICHSWAPATLQYGNSEPITVVGKKGHKITFGTSDLHALLSYHLHLNKTSKTGFMGSRCNLDFAELEKKLKNKEMSQKDFDEQISIAECKDTNAGAFHVALVNQIALMDQGFVADVTRDLEVWNQPVYSFEVKVLGVKNGATPGAAPGTVKEVRVYTRMGFVSEIEQHFAPVTKPFYIKVEEYEYRIELNAAGDIIGGEWISFERPDFIWKSAPVPFKGYFKDLENLYKKSVQYLLPTKFTEKIKAKFKKVGRVSLIEKEFIKDAKKEVALTKLREETHRIGVNHLAVEGFNDAAKKAMEARVAGHIASLKKEMRPYYLASKFVEGAKEEVRNTHIEHAIESAKEDLRKDFVVNTFINGMKLDANMTKVKEGAHTLSKASIFVNAVKKDAKETRKLKEEHKAAAKAEVMKAATATFLKNKFIAEVSKDAKETRRLKEEHKVAAKAEVMKAATATFLRNKFITEVSKDAKETRRLKEEHKAAAKAEVMKVATTNFLRNKFIAEVSKDAKENRREKELHKTAAKAEVMKAATANFLRNKFIAEVSKDAKESRARKEAHKDHAIAALNKFSNQNFYGTKFVKEVKAMADETRRIKDQRIADQLQLNKQLMTVVLAGDLVKFQELIKKGANPAYSDETGLTPLMFAAQKEQKGILTALLKVLDQTAINAVDKEGRNALIWAIVAPNKKPDGDTRAIVRLLLEKNIEVNQKDAKGMTALAYVTSGPFKSKLIEWALKDKGAKL